MPSFPVALQLPDAQRQGPLPGGFHFDLNLGYHVLVGPNNAGKSSILQFLFKQLMQIGTFGPDSVALILPQRLYVEPSAESGGRTLAHHNTDLAGQIGTNNFPYHNWVGPPASELLRVLLTHEDFYEQIGRMNIYLNALDLPRIVLRDSLRVMFGDILSMYQGSGLRNVLAILAALTDGRLSVVLVDEPEASLEARLQRKLRDLFYEVSKSRAIVVTTHSHLFLNRAIHQMNFLVTRSGGTVHVTPVKKPQELYDIAFEMLGSSLEDLFFPNNFLVVEGASDQIITQRVMELLDINTSQVKIISSTGVERVRNVITAIRSTLLPLIVPDSPYARKVVALIDKPANEMNEQYQKLRRLLNERLFELADGSIEEYLPEEFYIRCGRTKEDDLRDLRRLAGKHVEAFNLKKEISTAISAVLRKEDLEQIAVIRDAVLRANV